MTVRYYSSVATPTTLSAGINNSVTTISVGSVTGFPTLYPYTLAIDYDTALVELVEVTNAAGTTLTVTRAIDGTSATSHSGGAAVRHVASARDYQNSRDHEEDATDVHGTTGFVVGTSNTQTLTNKTLTTPTIGDFTNANHNHSNAAGGGSLLETTTQNDDIAGVPLTVNSVAGTTAQLQRWRLDGTNILHLNSSGEIVSNIPGAASNFIICNSTAAFTGDFIEMRKDGVRLFAVNTNGAINTVQGITSQGNISTTGTIGSTGNYTGSANFNTGAPVVFPTVWTSTSGTPDIGNGTMEMTYVLQGRLCHISFFFQPGTTTTYGNSNNAWIWSLPFPWLSTNRYGGIARATESIFRAGFIQANTANTFLINDITNGTGFSWGNRGDTPFTTPIDTSPPISFQAQFTYEIA